MLNLILGRASSGKTTYVRNIIAERVREGKQATLIVPEQFSFESERAIVSLLGAKDAASVRIVSFSSLSKKILDEYEPDRKPPVTQAAKAVLMSMTLEAAAEHLELFGGCRKNQKTIAELLHTADELIQCGVTPHELEDAAQRTENRVLIQKSEEIEIIAELYKTLLTERFSDDRYLINEAAKHIAEKQLFRGQTVVFDEFSGFTAQENLIVGELLQQADKVYVTQCAESLRDTSGGTGALSYAVDNLHSLIALANKKGVPIAEPVLTQHDGHYHTDAIAYLEKGLYEPDPEIYDGDAPEITVTAAENLYDECEFTAMTAKKLVRETGIRYRDIVVVSRSADYQKYLPFAFKKYDIPVFEDKRVALENALIVIFALSALSLAVEGITTDRIFRYLKTYIAGIPEDDIADLENYVFLWQIDYGGWLTDWTGHPEGLGKKFDEEAEEKLASLNATRQAVTRPILRLKEALRDKDGFGCTKALYEFLMQNKANEHLLSFAMGLDGADAYECERSWDELMDVLSLLADTIGTRPITPERYLELFRIMISSSDVGTLPGGLDQITVGNADRIRVSDKKVLFIVGANDGIFPAASSGSFILTENDRRLLKNNGVELGGDSIDKMRKERLRVYSTLSIPRDRLFVSYALSDFKGSPLSPSEIVTMICQIVPRHRAVEYALLDPLDTVESRQSAFESAALHFADNSAYASSVRQYVADADCFGDRLRAVERAVRREPVRFRNPEKAAALFGKNLYMTPSRIEDYYKCPFRYFCRYGLKASPLERATFDPRQNGLLVHAVLEKLFAEYGSRGLTALTKKERRDAVEREAEAYIEESMGGKKNMDERFLYSLSRCVQTICDILEKLVSEFSDCKFETRDVELRIGDDGDVPPYTVSLPGGGKAILNGVVDRVDTMEAEDGQTLYLRVIDYKTGGKDFHLEDVLSGLNIQMLVYLLCLIENGKVRYGETVPAGVLYVPAKKGKNELGRYASDEDIENATIASSRMKGIVLDDAEVIKGMDSSGGGRRIEATVKDDKRTKNKKFTLHQFDLLHRAIDAVIQDMGDALRKGEVSAVPMLDGNYKNTCRYCDYQTVCGHEDGDPTATLFQGDVWETLEEREATDNG